MCPFPTALGRRLFAAAIAGLFLVFWAGSALAHASDQGFVLLLPTDIYIAAGGLTVALTVLLLVVLPSGAAHRLFTPLPLTRPAGLGLRHMTSAVVTALLVLIVWQGMAGPRDPLRNPMPLTVWTLWWIGLVSLQGVLGNLWRWINPWTGVAAMLHRVTGLRAPFRYPRRLGHWPALAGFLAFAGFLLADIAPADPARLAVVVGLYWYAMLLGLVLFGPAWMVRAEAVTVLMRAYGRMGILGRARGRLALGLPGWRILTWRAPPLALAVFMVFLLGTGSFDGLNETFWWMQVLGLNPLEFPGRSAVVEANLTGLILSNLLLLVVFAGSLWLGERLSGTRRGPVAAVRLFAPTLLPIALGYHIAHYLTAALVEGQYLIAWLDDPLRRGWHLLGREGVYVTTGFFNTPGTVRAIWLAQAGAVVMGHVVAILLAHGVAVRAGTSVRTAVLGQLPLALFMIGYTVFGLWLLASPRGL